MDASQRIYLLEYWIEESHINLHSTRINLECVSCIITNLQANFSSIQITFKIIRIVCFEI